MIESEADDSDEVPAPGKQEAHFFHFLPLLNRNPTHRQTFAKPSKKGTATAVMKPLLWSPAPDRSLVQIVIFGSKRFPHIPKKESALWRFFHIGNDMKKIFALTWRSPPHTTHPLTRRAHTMDSSTS